MLVLRSAARVILLLIFISSFSTLVISIIKIMNVGYIGVYAERTVDEFSAAIEAELVKKNTKEDIELKLNSLLKQDPRNWVVLDSMKGVITEYKIDVSPAILAEFDRLREEDFGFLVSSFSCIKCAYSTDYCAANQLLICKLPIELTPISDIFVVSNAAADYVAGNEIDKIEFSLSTLGLVSTAMVPVTGGTTVAILVPIKLLKLARKIGALTKPLKKTIDDALLKGIAWEKVSFDTVWNNPTILVVEEAMQPIKDLTNSILQMSKNGMSHGDILDVMKNVDNVDDARRVVAVSTKFGSKTTGIVRVISKSRLARLGLRFADNIISAMFSIAGLLLSLTAAMISGAQALVTHVLKKFLRATNRRVEKLS